jgi:hypothetical protein
MNPVSLTFAGLAVATGVSAAVVHSVDRPSSRAWQDVCVSVTPSVGPKPPAVCAPYPLGTPPPLR